MNMRRVRKTAISFQLSAFSALLAAICCVSAAAQVAVSPWKSPHVTFTDQNGVALAGGCVFTYSGGTSTPLGTWTDSTGGTLNPNPVILDVTGSANIWLGPYTYKFAIWSYGGTNCASGALQWTVDMVPGNIFNNTTVTGGTWTGGTITGATISGGTISGAAITSSTVDSTPIGQTTPASGVFTSLAASLNSMSFSSTPVFAAGSYGYFTMTLTNNVTSSSITGGTNGQLITFDLCQNGTGQVVGGITTGFTFAWPANYTNPPVVNPALNACTIATAFYSGGFWTTVFTSQQLLVGNFDTVPYSATPIFPAASYSNFAITLTGNVTSSTLTGGLLGQLATIYVCQNGTGGNTFIWPTNLLNAPTVSSGAGTCTGVTAVYNGINWTTVASSTASITTPLTGNLDIIPFTATPIYSTTNFSVFEMTLSGNVTSSTISGGVPGQLIAIILTQGSSTTTAPASAPTSTTLTSGGNLPATTTYYTKCSYLFGTIESLPSAESSKITGSGSTNSIPWTCPSYVGVTSYKFYIGTGTGGENYYFPSTSNTYIQQDIPSKGTPGVPYTSSIYTVVWPGNLISAPTMSTGYGATTSLIAAFDGTNWITLGSTSFTGTTQHNVIAIWTGTSGTLVDDSEGGSGYQSSATNWGQTIYGTYYVYCSTTGWPAGSTLGQKIVWTAIGIPYSSTQFTYGVDSPTISAARGSTVTVTCMAVQ
jgi:hypothetical protein